MYLTKWQLYGVIIIIGYLLWHFSAKTDEEKEQRQNVLPKIWLLLIIGGGAYLLFWIVIFAIGLWSSIPENYKITSYSIGLFFLLVGIPTILIELFKKKSIKNEKIIKTFEKYGSIILMSSLAIIGVSALIYTALILFGLL